jgi:hypothetical protein
MFAFIIFAAATRRPTSRRMKARNSSFLINLAG